jgi:hypothetical protein
MLILYSRKTAAVQLKFNHIYFVYVLFNDALSSSEYIASDDILFNA